MTPSDETAGLQAELDLAQAFHRVAVQQRDSAWRELERLQTVAVLRCGHPTSELRLVGEAGSCCRACLAQMANGEEPGGPDYPLPREFDPCVDALDELWRDVILAHKPDYGDWEYPGQAYRHLLLEFEELREQRDSALARVEQLRGLISDLTDNCDCRFDHHGHCQEHSWFVSERPCPHGRAQALLDEEKSTCVS